MIKVTCALIIDEQLRTLCAQRSSKMSLPLKWEFPGGKIEAHESPEECLIREIKEELNVDIQIIDSLPPNIHSYPSIDIMLIPFVCKLTGGDMMLKEHCNIKWLHKFELLDLDWADADVPIVKHYLNT